jgi:plastocyanin
MIRKVLLTAVVLMSLMIVAVAAAKTVAVSITKNGYVPKEVTIAAGDTVRFTNSDTIAHRSSSRP